MSILEGDIQILNRNAFSGREGNVPRAIIVHGTASNAAVTAVDIAHYFASTQGSSNPVSAHFVVDKDGAVVRCNNLGDGAWGNGGVEAGHDAAWDTLLYPHGTFVNPNNVTFSIEHVKYDNLNAEQITPSQKIASFRLIAALCEGFGIPTHRLDKTGGISGHFSLAPHSRANCPGSYPFDELFQYLQGAPSMIFDETSPLFNTFFRKLDSHTWQTKANGTHIKLGMLDYYKTLSFDPQHQLPCIGLPLTEETYVQRSDNAPLSYQLCERGAMVYDPRHVYDQPLGAGMVYMAHIDNGIILNLLQQPVKDQLTAVQTQLSTCQTDLAACQKQSASALTEALQKVDAIIHPLIS